MEGQGNSRYFLVGYMGCGKTRRGRLMAQQLGIRFIDLDRYIADRERRNIGRIFQEDGEEGFRRLEKRYLHEVCELYGDFVLATGGGTPCFLDNMQYMNAMGHTVFLDVPVEVIVERLLRNRDRRPLVRRLSDAEVGDYVSRHLAERMPFYMQAKEIVR